VKSPKGTGKTYDLIKVNSLKAHAQGRKVLLADSPIVLGRAICKAVGIPWIEEMNSDADRKTEGKAMGFGLCVDSLHPLSQAAFNPLAWEGALVIVDEAEQFFGTRSMRQLAGKTAKQSSARCGRLFNRYSARTAQCGCKMPT
jgi:hypothetical protein